MGFALANSCLEFGAEVTLVTGPTQQYLVHPRLDIIRTETAEQMFEAAKRNWPSADIGIFSAAVADYRPKVNETEKRKKGAEEWHLEMVKNADILKWAGEVKTNHQCIIGFALESENVRENATNKLVQKKADMIVMNSIRDKGAGFEVDTNKVALLDKHNNFITFELKSKAEVADDIVQYFVKHLL
jgi:phosphopantothenoylcysteine decarboxylase/phosphopantothenate--cysteine ligase